MSHYYYSHEHWNHALQCGAMPFPSLSVRLLPPLSEPNLFSVMIELALY